MTLRLVWRAAAQADLREITAYAVVQDAAFARDLTDRIQACAESLADHPYLFPTGRIAGTREALVHPNYTLVYRADEDTVEIAGVLHTCREYPPAGE